MTIQSAQRRLAKLGLAISRGQHINGQTFYWLSNGKCYTVAQLERLLK